MKTIKVNANDGGQRLDKFLLKTFDSLPQSAMYKGIRTKNIKLNGKRCHASDRLKEGDVVSVYLKDIFLEQSPYAYDFMSAPCNLDIVYEDENIMLLNKKAGLLVHPDRGQSRDTLIARICHYLYLKKEYQPEKENSFTPALVNRIDRNTSGIVMAAKNAESLRILNQKLKDREIRKFYLCIVHGILKSKQDTLVAYLQKDCLNNRVFISDSKTAGGRAIRTSYRVIEEKNGLSLLEIELLTGRTHQIRAHMSSIGHPLLGDGKYGTNAMNKGTGFDKQALCSYRLIFDFARSGGILDYLAGREFKLDGIWFVDEFKKGINTDSH